MQRWPHVWPELLAEFLGIGAEPAQSHAPPKYGAKNSHISQMVLEGQEADSAGSARAEPAESAWTGFQGLTQKSPTVISRMDTYLPVSENPFKNIKNPRRR